MEEKLKRFYAHLVGALRALADLVDDEFERAVLLELAEKLESKPADKRVYHAVVEKLYLHTSTVTKFN